MFYNYSNCSAHACLQWLCLLVGLIFAAPLAATAQLVDRPPFVCATEDLLPADRQALEAEAARALRLKQSSGASFTAIIYVPIRPHIIRRTDGTGGYTMASLNNVIALTNKYYLQNGVGIQFYFAGTTPDFIDNDALYAQYRQGTDDATVAPRDVTNALNQYYVQQFNVAGLGGYAQFPADNVGSTRTIILNENDDVDMGNRLVPHELGHTFNLLHTHEPANGYELVTRGAGANCTTAGDLVCDTPADPYGRYSGATSSCVSGCPPTYTCSFTDTQGNLYTPSPTNIMSYYFPCIHDFTAGQYDRIQAGLALRQTHTSYTLNAPPTAMPAPLNVVASSVSGAIILTWQDNASNEMGYFIERSTSPTTGFAPIGGVGPNVTTFTDRSFASNIQYYYRVKGSNTTTGSTSSVTTPVVAPACRPNISTDGCPYGINITGITVNNTILSQNSGCSSASSGYYTSFSAVSGTVTAGQSATFTVSKGTANAMGGTIWVDLNNNSIFEPSEQLYKMPATNTAGTFSGSLAIPASTTATSVMMRVVATYNVVPNDPCGSYSYGETEDYVLTVIKAPDLTPILYARPTTLYGAKNLTVVVDVAELNSVATSGLFTVRVTKDPKVNLSFPTSATMVGGRSVQNSVWTFDGTIDSRFYVLTTTQSVAAGNLLSFGLTGMLSPGATTGNLSVSLTLLPTAMIEASQANNTDADKIDYFEK